MKNSNDGFVLVPMLIIMSVVVLLTGIVYKFSMQESQMLQDDFEKKVMRANVEELLKSQIKEIQDNNSIANEFNSITTEKTKPLYANVFNNTTYQVYGIKDNNEIILVGMGDKKNLRVRLYVHLKDFQPYRWEE